MTRVLVADNDKTFLTHISDFLESYGYAVITADNPAAARQVIEQKKVRIAVIDLKLTNDSPEDITGLDVARSTDPFLPKIIVSNYRDFDAMKAALGVDTNGLPSAIAYLDKTKLFEELIPAIHKGLTLTRSWIRTTQEIAQQLRDDYGHARRSAQIHTWVSLMLSIVFVLPIIYGVFKLHAGNEWTALFLFIGALGAEVTNYIFAKKLEFLYERVDVFHGELLQARRFEQLLDACESIGSEAESRRFRSAVLDAALNRWIGVTLRTLPTPSSDAIDRT